ncbi:MAG: type II secretion system protein GspN [Myxococcaceae bacterium]|nr:type II secretion system protein GspN [Myxococcaceae bacterium]
MADRKLKTWQRAVAYSAFGFVALIVAFFITFPYEALRERIRNEADAAGYFVRIGSMGPGFFAVRASDLQLSKKAAPDAEKPPEPLRIDSVSVGPTLFPPGVSVTAKLLDGSVKAKVGGMSTVSVNVVIDDLDLSKGNMKGFSGIDFSGSIDGEIDLKVPRAAVGGGPAEPDFGAASGTVALGTKALSVNGGTMSLVLPMYGSEPTPLDLPKIAVGDLEAKLSFDKGAGKVDELRTKSTDLEVQASGTLKLAKRIEYSEPNMEIRIKAEPEFVKRLGLIGSALSMIGPDPKDPNFRMGRLTGYLGRPNFR